MKPRRRKYIDTDKTPVRTQYFVKVSLSDSKNIDKKPAEQKIPEPKFEE